MSESESSENESNGMLWLNRIVIGGMICVFLYAIHFGPMVWALEYLEISSGGGRKEIIWTIEYPHLSLAYHSENYFNYMAWCGGSAGGLTWGNYRKHFEEYTQ